jgi:hypothetical protein
MLQSLLGWTQATGFCALWGIRAVLLTGIELGDVHLTVVPASREPALELQEWDEVVDMSVSAPAGELRVEPILDDAPALPALTAHGGGCYRVRCKDEHAR